MLPARVGSVKFARKVMAGLKMVPLCSVKGKTIAGALFDDFDEQILITFTDGTCLALCASPKGEATIEELSEVDFEESQFKGEDLRRVGFWSEEYLKEKELIRLANIKRAEESEKKRELNELARLKAKYEAEK